jgi:hypothetical protein
MTTARLTARQTLTLGAFAMASNRSAEYMKLFAGFVHLIQNTTRKHLDAPNVGLFPRQGRAFDRIVVERQGAGKGTEEVLFFVRISDGAIFGPKSDIAPNLNWWYGSLATVKEWNFKDPFHPAPRDPSQFREMAKYGAHVHYIPKGMHFRLTDRKTPLPAKRTARKPKQ